MVWIHGPSWLAAWREATSSQPAVTAPGESVGRSPEDLVTHAERKAKAAADKAELEVQILTGSLVKIDEIRPDIEYAAEPFRTAAESMCPMCRQKQFEACEESEKRLHDRFAANS